ncbi:MAG: DMT family transporter, partial [Verrucomicrobiota bacterium]
AIGALLGGAIGIGLAPIFVRLSEVGPVATAFYRLLFALPVLWSWMYLAGRSHSSASRVTVVLARPTGRSAWMFGAAGFFFAGDLAFWHWSIKLTSVANSTLLTNFAPFFVVLGASILFHERITPILVVGMLLAFAGGILLVSDSLRLEWKHVWGDLLAIVTAIFYAAYLLAIKFLRRTYSPPTIMAWAGLVTCPLLMVAAWVGGENFLALSWKGWLVLLLLALLSHVAGQGLITYAAAHLSASLLSISLMLQPVVAAVLAWILLNEPLSWQQIAGGIVILAGIALASQAKS